MPGVYDLSTPIETERLTLRVHVPEDIDALYEIRRRPDVNVYLYSEAMTRDEVQAKLDERIAKYSALTEPGDSALLAVIRKGTGEFIGDVSLQWATDHDQVEIGYVLHPEHHGQGFATEAARVLLRIAFEHLKAHRVIGRLEGRNIASARSGKTRNAEGSAFPGERVRQRRVERRTRVRDPRQ